MVILVLMLGTANKLKTARQIALTGAVSGSTNFDGSGNVSIITKQANIASVTGELSTIPASGESTSFNTATLDFPSGFNSDNCIVIGWYVHHKTEDPNAYGKAFGYTNPLDSRTWLRGGVASMVTFNHKGNGKITFTLEAPFTSSYTYEFKIVLMKIS